MGKSGPAILQFGGMHCMPGFAVAAIQVGNLYHPNAPQKLSIDVSFYYSKAHNPYIHTWVTYRE